LEWSIFFVFEFFLDKIAVLQKGFFFLTLKQFHVVSPGLIISWAKKASVWVCGARHTLLLAVFARVWHLHFCLTLCLQL
uniref:Uncharacterized protein n=1 Tax=Cyanistes caeruleus TaxID=156563 RepID=A0A8C0VRY2_CYACU